MAAANAELTWLAGAIERGRKSSRYCVSGDLELGDPGLSVDGVGRLPLPLKPKLAKQLIEVCSQAPYGQGTKTLLDTRVRKTWELDASKFHCSPEWDAVIAGTTRRIAEQLGLPADELTPQPYKLLLYEKGGFFKPHRDSEKHDGMVATLIVVLPTYFDGGALTVCHNGNFEKFKFESATQEKLPAYAAFYADCEHEVQRVMAGRRVALAYNLVLKRSGRRGAKSPRDPSATLVQAIHTWSQTQPGEPLVFALEHLYSQKGLSLQLLKGRDRALADAVTTAADATACHVHLAQVERHINQYADDGSYGDWRYRRSRSSSVSTRQLELGEVYEEATFSEQWTDLSGKSMKLGTIPFSTTAIISEIPLEDWQPTRQEYEGYTGNAGNTLDRWYHRSALVVWPRDQHYLVLASAGQDVVLPKYLALHRKLAKVPRKRRDEAQAELVQFARAIIDRWPQRYGFNSRREWGNDNEFTQPVTGFIDSLNTLGDLETVRRFLIVIAQRDRTLPISELIVTAGRECGWEPLREPLLTLLAPEQEQRYRDDEIPHRDYQWFRAICRERKADAARDQLIAALGPLILQRFCQPPKFARRWADDERESELTSFEAGLLPLVEAFLGGGRMEELQRTVDFVRAQPGMFRRDVCQVPTLNKVIPAARKVNDSVPKCLTDWLEAVRRQLTEATAEEPQPPSDWARVKASGCECRFCQQLNEFLTNPHLQTGEIAAAEYNRSHIISQISQHRLDVTHALLKRSTPYRLMLTKTSRSFERSRKRYRLDCKLLDSLPAPQGD